MFEFYLPKGTITPMDSDGLKVEFITLENWIDTLLWRNNPLVYRWNKTNRPIDLAEHIDWFVGRQNKIIDEPILSYHLQGIFIGVARLDLLGISTYEVSIIVNPEMRGQGNGKLILNDICFKTSIIPTNSNLIAVIHRLNEVSQKLFKNFGFQFLCAEGEFQTYKRSTS